MITHLPLVFCNGKPANLQKMKVDQLEKFLTYLIHCSQNLKMTIIVKPPVWWTKKIPFSNPVSRPKKKFSINAWKKTLINQIRKCYRFYGETSMIHISVMLSRIVEHLEYVNLPNNIVAIKNKRNNKQLAAVRQNLLEYDNYDDLKKWSTNRLSFKLPKFVNSAVSQEEFLKVLNLKKSTTCTENKEPNHYKLRQSKINKHSSVSLPIKKVFVKTYSLDTKQINQIKDCLKKKVRVDELIVLVHFGKFHLIKQFSEMDTVELNESDDDDDIIIITDL